MPLVRDISSLVPPLLSLERVHVGFARSPSLHDAWQWARGRSRCLRPAPVRAVDDVTLHVRRGEVLALVGESGCGKSTLGRVAVGLQRATSGQRLYQGRPIDALQGADARATQLKLQMVFQDPSASLNPRMRVSELIGEAPVVHGLVSRHEQSDYVAELLRSVGLDPAMAQRHAHQFSGGQRARIGIARALAVKPEFIVCDEAVAALDVSVQSQVLNLFAELRQRLALSYLFVSHNLAVVRHMADRVAVMYLGRVVESADVHTLFTHPAHPYTRALLAEMPSLRVGKRSFMAVQGEMPSPLAPPPGCHFHPRCPLAMPRCRTEAPPLLALGSTHQVACHLHPIAGASAAQVGQKAA
jgi:peptide/nickel transport system ATP-binding protein